MKKHALVYLPFYGLFIFLVCNLTAMYFYPGGTINNHESINYDFFRNFLSQLGRTKAYRLDAYGNQISNLISFRIWTSGMATTGIIFLIYYSYLLNKFQFQLNINTLQSRSKKQSSFVQLHVYTKIQESI